MKVLLIRGLPALALSLLAIVGPWLAGRAETPTLAPTAVQLLPPGAVVVEGRLAGGGFVRGRQLAEDEHGLRVRSAEGWRTFVGQHLAEPPRARRMWLGTDHQGRDLLARTLRGSRTSLLVALVASSCAVLLGTVFGMTCASLGRPAAALLRLNVDSALALPRLLLLLILGLLLRGNSVGIAFAIGLASWMEVARLVEAESRSLLSKPFMEAVRAGGVGRVRRAVRHLLPNLAAVLATATPLVAAQAVVLESTLSFLGLGVPDVSWGAMIADGRRLLPRGWWSVVFPGVLLVLTALSVHRLSGADGASGDRARAAGAFPARGA